MGVKEEKGMMGKGREEYMQKESERTIIVSSGKKRKNREGKEKNKKAGKGGKKA